MDPGPGPSGYPGMTAERADRRRWRSFGARVNGHTSRGERQANYEPIHVVRVNYQDVQPALSRGQSRMRAYLVSVDSPQLLRLAAHIERLALRKRRDVADKLRHLLAAIGRRFPSKRSCNAVSNLVFQCLNLVRFGVETRIDRCGVSKTRDGIALAGFAGPRAALDMAGLAGVARAAESFMNKQRFPVSYGFFQVGLGGGSLVNACSAKP